MFKTISLVLFFVAVSYAFELPLAAPHEVEYHRVERGVKCLQVEHEEYACRVRESKCEDLALPPHTLRKDEKCTNGCYCVKGYYRNNKGQCVLPSECHTKPHGEPKPHGEHKPHGEPKQWRCVHGCKGCTASLKKCQN